MIKQSQIDYKALFAEKYGLNPKDSELIYIWDLHYKHEVNKPFEDELRKRISETLPNEDQQEVYDTILVYFEDVKRCRRFFQRSHPEGYGYEVIDRNEGNFKIMLHTYDKQKSIDYCNELIADENATPPETSSEVPPKRILVINHKYGSIYFSADTPEEYKEKAVGYIIKQANNEFQYYPPRDETDKKYLGFTEDEINSMPKGRVKDVAIIELNNFKEREAHNKAHEIAWKTLEVIKKVGTDCTIVDISKVLNFYEGERCNGHWGIVDLM